MLKTYDVSQKTLINKSNSCDLRAFDKLNSEIDKAKNVREEIKDLCRLKAHDFIVWNFELFAKNYNSSSSLTPEERELLEKSAFVIPISHSEKLKINEILKSFSK